MKTRVWVSLPEALAVKLARAATDARVLKSDIVEDALKAYIEPKPDPSAQALFARRLDQLSRSLGIVGRDVAIVTETLGLYVRYFLTVTPPLGRAEQEPARALGRDRFERFVAQVGRRLGSDQRLIAQVLETIASEKPELFADAIADAKRDGELAESQTTDDAVE